MKVEHLPENGKDFIPYEISGKTIDFDDGELSFNVSKKERDYEVVLDICMDYTGSLVMGAADGQRYVAQVVIPPRKYTETMTEDPDRTPNAEGGMGFQTTVTREAVPFSMDRCTLILWEMEE